MHTERAYSLEAYDYFLPPELIAQEPAPVRDASRLMLLDTHAEGQEHLNFHDLPRLFRAGDVLVLNNTRVFPARLLGHKESGGRIELFLLGFPVEEAPAAGGPSERSATARALLKSSKRAKPGTRLFFDGALSAEVMDSFADGSASVRLRYPADQSLESLLSFCGRMPLPPYIVRESEQPADRERYQTCYAQHTGSVAAPTAGLHFTPELLAELSRMGVQLAPLTLHVGYGTFAPVRTADIRQHQIHQEWVSVPAESAAAVNAARQEGRRVWAVGTTSTRTLEFVAAQHKGELAAWSGPCTLYIYPGFRFQVVDNLVTNFHLPKSSLLFLVSALAGQERILAAYQEAVRLRYRFFSYGDAMAIVTKR